MPEISTVYCGGHEFALHFLLVIATWLHHKSNFIPFTSRHDLDGVECATFMWQLTYGDTENYDGALPLSERLHVPRSSLFRMLQRRGEFCTRDPKDYVYGGLGLYQRYYPSRKLPRQLKADYSKPFASILQSAIKAALVRATELGLGICFGTFNYRPEDISPTGTEMASWVPRISRPWCKKYDAYSIPGPADACGSRARGKLRIVGPEGSVVVLRGLIIGRVEHTGPVWTRARLKSDSAIRARLSSFLETIGGQECDIERLAMALIAGIDGIITQLSLREATTMLYAFRAELDRNCIPGGHPQSSPAGVRHMLAVRYRAVLWGLCRNRRLFTTEQGYIGLGPRILEPADMVAVLWGFRRPWVLRPLPGLNKYKICDEAYIYDVMDGQWADGLVAHGYREQVFYIH